MRKQYRRAHERLQRWNLRGIIFVVLYHYSFRGDVWSERSIPMKPSVTWHAHFYKQSIYNCVMLATHRFIWMFRSHNVRYNDKLLETVYPLQKKYHWLGTYWNTIFLHLQSFFSLSNFILFVFKFVNIKKKFLLDELILKLFETIGFANFLAVTKVQVTVK